MNMIDSQKVYNFKNQDTQNIELNLHKKQQNYR